ncbi:MAG: DUF4253 domain-containing protein [Lachnospira sp.]|jgi:hypothetical protein|nr:DUF4253 domain-containing protein [Lachnospira sp.]
MDKEKLIMEKVGCPCKVFELTDNMEEEVLKAYCEALERGKKEGFTPVILADDEDLNLWFDNVQDYSKEEELAKELGNGKEILEERFKEYTEDISEDWINEVSNENWADEFDGDGSINEFTFLDVKEIVLFEVPTKNPWEVIAWFPMGGWNECPWVDDMMAISHYWYEKYHAFPAVITRDVLQYFVENPVDNEKEALELAKEHYAFCTDRLDQGTASGTINEVADSLIDSKVWFFWWD